MILQIKITADCIFGHSSDYHVSKSLDVKASIAVVCLYDGFNLLIRTIVNGDGNGNGKKF